MTIAASRSGLQRAMSAADGDASTAVDPGMARAGAAAAARRRELDISQRSLAADGIINAGALISFEKGRSWPRDRTRARLEEVLRWPPGTIAKLRAGDPTDRRATDVGADRADEGSLIAEAVVAAVNTLGSTVDALPAADDPAFTPRISAILSDLRQLEAVAARATRIGAGHADTAPGAEHRAPPHRGADGPGGVGAARHPGSAAVRRPTPFQPDRGRDGSSRWRHRGRHPAGRGRTADPGLRGRGDRGAGRSARLAVTGPVSDGRARRWRGSVRPAPPRSR